jgi:hypothetical protein
MTIKRDPLKVLKMPTLALSLAATPLYGRE